MVATNDLDFSQNIIFNSPSFVKSAMGFLMTSQSGGAEFYISSKQLYESGKRFYLLLLKEFVKMWLIDTLIMTPKLYFWKKKKKLFFSINSYKCRYLFNIFIWSLYQQ